MGTSRTKPRRCETCAFYTSSDMKGQGWCTHPKRQQSGGLLLLVRAHALDCRNSWGTDFWTPTNAHAAADYRTRLPTSPPAAETASTEPTAEDDVVIHQTSVTKDDRTAMTNVNQNSRDNHESINHAALSDQEDRAQVMARGAREAILRARERKKERIGLPRQPHVAPLPAADMAAGDWAPADAGQDDAVLGVRHRPVESRRPAIDPFRRSYDDPAPPVPSGELPAEARRIVSRPRDDRFETVPEVQADFALPRPAHFAASARRGQAGTDDEPFGDESQLPENPELSSYDRVLQRARRVQRLAATRPPRRTIHQEPTPVATSPSAVDMTGSFDIGAGEPASYAEDQAILAAAEWHDDRPETPKLIDASDRSADELSMEPEDATGAEPGWGDDIDPFPEADDAPWLAAGFMTAGRGNKARSRFRMPQFSLRRHNARLDERPGLISASSDEDLDDEIVEQTTWTEPPPPTATPAIEEDPDWVDEIVPVESYTTAQPAPVPADMSAGASGRVVWDDDAWTPPKDSRESEGATWLDEEVVHFADDDDLVTGEATVPDRPQSAPASFDLANLRARLFSRERPARADLGDAGTAHRNGFGTREAQPLRTEPAPAAERGLTPDDDPDPDPGSGNGFAAALPSIDSEWTAPNGDFDLRAVVRRQDELLDMQIQIAPDVPRMCRTCRNFRPADGGERGWCTNEWAFAHRRMVNADDLPCESTIGCWWLPNDATWLPEDDLAALTRPTPLIDRLLGRLRIAREPEDSEEPLRASAR